MDDRLIAEIKAFVERYPLPRLAPDAMLSAEDFKKLAYTPRALFPIAAKREVVKAETQWGFALPPLLKRLILEVTNGIAGFSYDIMGLERGCASDSGNLLEAYHEFKTYGEFESAPWEPGLLPFCNWGCAIYSCVDCTDPSFPVHTHEDSGVWPERYTLSEFFEMWLMGKVEFSQEGVAMVTKEGTNPFTGEKMTLSARTRRKRGS